MRWVVPTSIGSVNNSLMWNRSAQRLSVGFQQRPFLFNRGFSATAKKFFNSTWTHYTEALEKKPILTKSITAGVLSFIADAICQKGFGNTPNEGNKEDTKVKKELDFSRIGKFTFLGVALVGPLLHFWYGGLARGIPGVNLVSTLKRLALDQLLFAPAFIAIFFTSALTLEGKSFNEIMTKLNNEWVHTVQANWSIWTPAQFINFRFIDPKYQVLFSNCVGVVWNIYLSYATYNKKEK